MKINHLLALLIVSMFLTACFTTQQASFYRSPSFNSNATFKVITLNTNDGIGGRIEHYLLTNNFRVISDNSFRLPGSTAYPNPTTPLDTSRYGNNPLVVNIPYMEEHASDYIIRYQFVTPPAGAGEDAKSSLNILVANTRTGEAEISYLVEQKGIWEQSRLDRLIQNFVDRLRDN